MRPLTRLLQVPWRSRSAIARDVDAELSFHLEMRVNELRALGVDPDDARRRATDEFGDLEFTRRYCRRVDEAAERESRLVDRLADWRQDARYAVRSLRRNPGFAAVSLVTLMLAIGANTAIFTVARAVLLKPLPYGAPATLVALYENWPGGDPDAVVAMSPPNYADYRARQHSFVDVAAFVGTGSMTWLADGRDPEMVPSVAVTPNIFSVLKVPAFRGRTFAAGEGAAGNDTHVVISYGLWQRAFGGDSAAIGKRITLNGHRQDVIGVMPKGFTLGRDEELWTPDDLHDDLAASVRTRRQHYVNVVGRLRPGISIDAASKDVKAIARQLEAEYPDANTGRTAIAKPLHETMIGKLEPALLLLQGAAAMVLLIACANLANLTLSRTLSRRREMALRAALGAGRTRLVLQLITESTLLALGGGALGVALAWMATRTLLAVNPETLPAIFTATVDTQVIAFSVGLSLVTGVLFGLIPAIDASRADLHDSLKDGGRAASGGKSGERLRRALVAVQVGLAVMLLVGAGLLARSFAELTRVQSGFDADHVVTATVRASGSRYDSAAAVNRFYDALLADIGRAPGVVAAAATNQVPTRGRVSSSIRIEGEPVDERNLPDLGYISVRGDYFKALRIPVLAGRVYDETDLPTGPKTAVINEAAARRFFPNGSALGRRIHIGPNPAGPPMTIVGVVGDIRDEGLAVSTKPTLFANHRQEAWERGMSLVVRTSGDAQAVAPAIRRALKSVDPGLAIKDVRTLNEVVGSSLAPRRFSLGLAGAFAGLALVLAAIGIYGVLAYMVTTRTRELGVRMALGATRRDVLFLVARHGFAWSLIGMALGVAGAVAGARLLARSLYGVRPLDPATFGAVAAVLLVVVAAACLIPASRATTVDPLTSMRSE